MITNLISQGDAAEPKGNIPSGGIVFLEKKLSNGNTILKKYIYLHVKLSRLNLLAIIDSYEIY